MSDYNIGSSIYANTVNNSTSSSSQSSLVDADMFLKLLMTQMQHQDPLSGGSDPTEQISQLATFAMVEQLTTMTDLLTANQDLMMLNQGADLIGKEVTINIDDENTVTGVVEKVQVVGGTPLLKIGEDSYPVYSVVEINEATN